MAALHSRRPRTGGQRTKGVRGRGRIRGWTAECHRLFATLAVMHIPAGFGNRRRKETAMYKLHGGGCFLDHHRRQADTFQEGAVRLKSSDAATKPSHDHFPCVQVELSQEMCTSFVSHSSSIVHPICPCSNPKRLGTTSTTDSLPTRRRPVPAALWSFLLSQRPHGVLSAVLTMVQGKILRGDRLALDKYVLLVGRYYIVCTMVGSSCSSRRLSRDRQIPSYLHTSSKHRAQMIRYTL